MSPNEVSIEDLRMALMSDPSNAEAKALLEGAEIECECCRNHLADHCFDGRLICYECNEHLLDAQCRHDGGWFTDSRGMLICVPNTIYMEHPVHDEDDQC